MAMIATIHPYKNENGMSYNQRRTSSSTTSTEREQQPYTSGIFRIEDVTDDPRYADIGNDSNSVLEKEEGALVEYCRSKVVQPSAVINQPPQIVRRPSFSASSVLGTTKNSSETERRGRLQNKTQAIEASILARAAAGFTSQNHQQRSSSRPARFTPLNVRQPINNNISSANRGRTLGYALQIPSSTPSQHESRKTATTANNTRWWHPLSKFVTGINSSSSSTSSNINPNPLPTTNNNHNSTTNRIRSSSTNSGGNNVKSVVSGSGGFGNNNNNNRAALISTTKRFDQKMAHVIDVEVGQPCSRMAICNCYGFRPHTWRKVCVHCKCDRSDHEIGGNQALNVYERLGIKPSSAEMAKVLQQQQQQRKNNNNENNSNDVNSSSSIGSAGHGYAWVPPGIGRLKVEEYMSQLPNHIIPRLNSIGEKNRERQLMIQLPRQDLSIAYCKHLRTQQERRLYEEFVNARNEVALDIGHVNANIIKAMECRKCRGVVERNEMAVIAPKLGENTGWHAACFVCQTCEQLLVDLTYCVRDEKVYCERHFAELHKPRCSACDEVGRG
uniref:Uncharacterized protein n=1 Tax=Meloidogyne incognita TaxID=6306 RepID=A0A914LZK0_MELIC